MNRMQGIAARAAGIAATFVAWQVASGFISPVWLPGPVSVAQRAWAELAGGMLWPHVMATLKLLVAGTVLGALAGCMVACLLRMSQRVDQMLQPVITAFMSVPKLGLVPLLVLWFGTGLLPKVALVALTVFFIVFSFVHAGLVTVDSRLVLASRVLGARRSQVVRYVVLPSVWPFVLTGLEVALPWAVSAALVAEYMGAKSGIGHGIEQARQISDSTGVFYGIALATAVVLVFNGAIAAARRWNIK